MSKKQLFTAIGPFLTALLIIAVVIYSPFNWFSKPTAEEIEKSASSMSVNVLKGNVMKNEAVASGDYLPFFGSSELSRFDAYHPSVLAKKYDRDYTPFLLGAPGTQSLTHFQMMNSMGEKLRGKKAVFIISPQWFVKDGVSDPMFSNFYSPLQMNQYLMNLEKPDEYDQYLGKRLLHFSSIKKDTEMKATLKGLKQGEAPTTLEHKKETYTYHMLSKQDYLFSRFKLKTYSDKIEKKTKYLPDEYSVEELDKRAYARGVKATDNNEFQIINRFYTSRIAPIKGNLKNSQADFNFLESPEYRDFQLVLNTINKYDMDVLFVIPPVNALWSSYTGLSTDMLDAFSKKITYQLQSQGFNHIADYTQRRAEPYFMEDTIHIGWRGWVAMDQDLQTFLSDTNKPHYDMKTEEFLDKQWENKQVK